MLRMLPKNSYPPKEPYVTPVSRRYCIFTMIEAAVVTTKAADRVKAGKKALWAAFRIKDRKFPRWVQEADWSHCAAFDIRPSPCYVLNALKMNGFVLLPAACAFQLILVRERIIDMEINHRSSLFQEASADEIREIFQKSLQESEIVDTKLMDGGIFNTTYFIIYGHDRKKAVLRLGPINRHRLMGFEQNLMAAETYVYSVCQNIGIPCSRVLVCDTTRSIVNRDFMIVEYIPSVTMVNAELSAEKRSALNRQLGQYLHHLHQVVGSSFGFVSRVQAGRRFAKWSDALIFEIEDITGRLENLGGLSEAQATAVRTWFYRSAELLDEIKIPRLLHTDLWAGNVLLDQESLEIKAMIDSDRAVFGDPDFEFAAPWMENPDLQEGYGFTPLGPRDKSRAMRRLLYQAFYYALEAYVGIGEYNNMDLHRERKKQLLGALSTAVQLAGGSNQSAVR